ncbi:MAG: succinate dehydrogenase assembly factor 2 [Deltaproteobacteria bacterium]|nr:succinate dehydrogenase assembly factor 2 [Deltaproteobacteria bacterium]
MSDDRELLIRRLKYLCRRRSTLELDVMLARIAKNLSWSDLTDQDLAALTTILETDEIVLQKALLTREPDPTGADGLVWARVLAALTL